MLLRLYLILLQTIRQNSALLGGVQSLKWAIHDKRFAKCEIFNALINNLTFAAQFLEEDFQSTGLH